MATYRTGFGTGTFGVRAFGLDGAITDAISLAETASTTVVNAEVVKDASAAGTASSANTASGFYVVDASASASSSASSSSAGEVIYLGSATSSAGVTLAEASLQFLTNAEAYGTATSSTTSDCVRVRFTTQVVDANASATCDGFITAWGGATIDANSGDLSSCERIRKSPAIANPELTFNANGRFKYEQIAKDNETWAVVPQGNEIWTEVA